MKKSTIYLILILILISIANAVTVSNPKPTITARYNETVTIIARNLTYMNSTPVRNVKLTPETLPLPLLHAVQGIYEGTGKYYYDFIFSTTENQPEGNYRFMITSVDDLNNEKNTTYNFTIAMGPLNVTMDKPAYGVSYLSTFDIIIGVNREANCRFYDLSGSGNDYFSIMSAFDQGRSYKGQMFTKTAFTLTENPMDFFVYCNDSLYGKFYLQKFVLSRDTTPPVLNIMVNPDAIYDESEKSEGNVYIFNITVGTDDLTTCRYSDATTNYDDMAGFAGEIMANEHKYSMRIPYITDQSYSYNIICKNAAGLQSNLYTFNFAINLNMSLKINILSPVGWINKKGSFDIKLHTTKKALCRYTYGAIKNMQIGGVGYDHSIPWSTSTEGIDYIYIGCTGTDTQNYEQEVPIMVDTIPPSQLSASDDSDLIDNKAYTYHLDRLTAQFKAWDNGSKVKWFNFSILNKSNGDLIYQSTEEVDSGDCDENNTCIKPVVVDDLELANKTTYQFKVSAVDAAGLSSAPVSTDGITVDTSMIPVEKTPPKGGINKEETSSGIRVTIYCQEVGLERSGCAKSLYQYSLVSKKEDCEDYYESYSEPVLVKNTTWFCWEVSDNAGNKASGSEQIEIVPAKDKDGDGIADPDDNCPNMANEYQEDTDSDNIGDECDNCARKYNPSQYDADNDAVGDACDTCPDTEEGAEINSYGCSDNQVTGGDDGSDDGTKITDSDSDGMPDEWELANGLDPNDPYDADTDNDGDVLTNLQEYTYNTNPNNIDTDGDSFSDLEEINQGTNPLDGSDYPKKGSVWSVLLLVFGILVLLAGGGYLGYTYYLKDKLGGTKLLPKSLGSMPTGINLPRQSGSTIPRPGSGAPHGPVAARKPMTPEQRKLIAKKMMQRRAAKEQQRKNAFASISEKPDGSKPGLTKPQPKSTISATKPAQPKQGQTAAKTESKKEGISDFDYDSWLRNKAKERIVNRLRRIDGPKDESKEDVFNKLASISKKKK